MTFKLFVIFLTMTSVQAAQSNCAETGSCANPDVPDAQGLLQTKSGLTLASTPEAGLPESSLEQLHLSTQAPCDESSCKQEAEKMGLLSKFSTEVKSNGAPAGCMHYNDGRVIYVETCVGHANCGTETCNGCRVLPCSETDKCLHVDHAVKEYATCCGNGGYQKTDHGPVCESAKIHLKKQEDKCLDLDHAVKQYATCCGNNGYKKPQHRFVCSIAKKKATNEATCHFTSCGRKGRCSGESTCTTHSEKHNVRCCSDTKISGWKLRRKNRKNCKNCKNRNVCTYIARTMQELQELQEQCKNCKNCKKCPCTKSKNFVATDGSKKSCQRSKTYDEANIFCTSVGARLCTVAEAEANCLRGTGCRFDKTLIWTSTTEASLLEVPVLQEKVQQMEAQKI